MPRSVGVPLDYMDLKLRHEYTKRSLAKKIHLISGKR